MPRTQRMTVGEIVGEPLMVHGLAKSVDAAKPVVQELLNRCGLPDDAIDRWPSGPRQDQPARDGQRVTDAAGSAGAVGHGGDRRA